MSANQNDITNDYETFELEYEPEGTWRILSKAGNYWGLGAASAIQTSSKNMESAGHFRIKWNADEGTCSLLASSKATTDESTMKWVCARKSGQLCVGTTEPVGFFMVFQNRTVLNLRALNGSGFVGLKLLGSSKIEANKTSPDSIIVEYANNEHKDDNKGTFDCCYFRMPSNNKYWSVIDGNQVACDSNSHNCAQKFLIELRSNCAIAIRLFEASSYLNLNKQGAIGIKECDASEATLWEF